MNKACKETLKNIKAALQGVDYISSARVYGSWLYNELSVDVDVAVMVVNNFGVIDPNHYYLLRDLRKSLSVKVGQDIDLVPHTNDELTDYSSPLWYPRYNPSLVFGCDIKDVFHVAPASMIIHSFSFADLTRYVLHDNRTICRRQLVRSLNDEEGRIFVSKLLHGPGNALTYQACRHKVDYLTSPSNLQECFDVLDRIYGVDSTPALAFFLACKRAMNFDRGVLLMNWYENLFNLIIHGDWFRSNYQRVCCALSKY